MDCLALEELAEFVQAASRRRDIVPIVVAGQRGTQGTAGYRAIPSAAWRSDGRPSAIPPYVRAGWQRPAGWISSSRSRRRRLARWAARRPDAARHLLQSCNQMVGQRCFMAGQCPCPASSHKVDGCGEADGAGNMGVPASNLKGQGVGRWVPAKLTPVDHLRPACQGGIPFHMVRYGPTARRSGRAIELVTRRRRRGRS